jgi:predicted aspartyl protease
VVQSTLRDEQITSDGTQFHADQHIAHITDSGDHAILDTGASIPVIPPKVADDLQLKIITLDSPIRVMLQGILPSKG